MIRIAERDAVMTRTCSMLGAAAVVALATSAAAQPAAAPTAQEQLRHQIYLMEGVLGRAVTSGAARLNAQFRALLPDMVVVAGEANARGFNLDGYGVFFDVEVPVLRQSMMWSLRTMLDHGFLKHLGIEVIPDRFQMAALFSAEQAPCPTHLQIPKGDLKTGSQFGEIPYGGQPFLCRFPDDTVRPVGDQRVSLAFRSAHSPP